MNKSHGLKNNNLQQSIMQLTTNNPRGINHIK